MSPLRDLDKREAALRRYRALLGISELILQHRDLPSLFHELVLRLSPILSFDFLTFILHDSDRNLMKLYLVESKLAADKLPLPLELSIEESASGYVWTTQKPLTYDEKMWAERFPKIARVLRDYGVKSYYLMPLTSAQHRVGALGVGSRKANAYDADDIEFLEHMAAEVAVAVDNALGMHKAQVFQEELALERDRLRLLLEINNILVSNLDIRQLFEAVSQCLRRVIQNDYTSLALYDQASGELRLRAIDFPQSKGFVHEDAPVPMEGSIAGRTFTSRKPVLLDQGALQQYSSDLMDKFRAEGMNSAVCLPLMSRNAVIGTVTLGSVRDNAFRREDLDLLMQIANQVAIAIENAMAFQQIEKLNEQLAKEKLYLEDEIRTEYPFDEIVGDTSGIKSVLRQIETVAPTDATVIILGETGTGKELVARAIHDLSPRRERTFVKVNCAAIPAGLLEAELFGHEKGAFTGAMTQRIGRMELADGGTFFLDEIGDVPLELQPKLLRALQEKEIERLGGGRTIRIDVRVVAATNRDLDAMVASGEFRRDLFYRLKVFPITVPPLRERTDDIPKLVRYFTQKFATRMNRRIDTIPSEAMQALASWRWPGNVRELENIIERAVILSNGPVLQVPLREVADVSANQPAAEATLESAERQHIVNAIRASGGRISGPNGAAARLGLKRTTLYSKMKKLGIQA